MVTHTFYSSTRETEAEGSHLCLKPAWATEWKLVSKKKEKLKWKENLQGDVKENLCWKINDHKNSNLDKWSSERSFWRLSDTQANTDKKTQKEVSPCLQKSKQETESRTKSCHHVYLLISIVEWTIKQLWVSQRILKAARQTGNSGPSSLCSTKYKLKRVCVHFHTLTWAV